MKEAYKKLDKHKRAYVTYAIGQSFIDLTETVINQLQKYSEYPIVLYYADGNVNFDSPNLIKQRLGLPLSPEEKRIEEAYKRG